MRERLPRYVIALIAFLGGVSLIGLLLADVPGPLLLASVVGIPLGAFVMIALLVGALRARTPGALPLLVGASMAVGSIAVALSMTMPFVGGLYVTHYGMVLLAVCALVALARQVQAMNERAQRASAYALAAHTHKFESRYLDQLVGPYPQEAAVYHARSPINFIHQLSCPVIFFQGAEDVVVHPEQSERMFESMRDRGIPTAYLLFEGEQHGFRKAENQRRALDGELYFYSRIFGFEPAGEIEPVPIENI